MGTVAQDTRSKELVGGDMEVSIVDVVQVGILIVAIWGLLAQKEKKASQHRKEMYKRITKMENRLTRIETKLAIKKP